MQRHASTNQLTPLKLESFLQILFDSKPVAVNIPLPRRFANRDQGYFRRPELARWGTRACFRAGCEG